MRITSGPHTAKVLHLAAQIIAGPGVVSRTSRRLLKAARSTRSLILVQVLLSSLITISSNSSMKCSLKWVEMSTRWPMAT